MMDVFGWIYTGVDLKIISCEMCADGLDKTGLSFFFCYFLLYIIRLIVLQLCDRIRTDELEKDGGVPWRKYKN